MKLRHLGFVIFLIMFVPGPPLHAQGGTEGCTDSPENPTAVLAVVSTVGIGLAGLQRKIRDNASKKSRSTKERGTTV